MKMTRDELFNWAKHQTQWIENEVLSPHNPDVADSEIIDVLPWENFVYIIYAITEGRVKIEEMEE